MNTEKKIAFRLTDKQVEELEKLKKKSYFNVPYSALYRAAIDAGIKALNAQKKGE